MSNFYNRLDEQESVEYGDRIRIETDLRKYKFELVYRKVSDNEFQRSITVYDRNGIIQNTDTQRQQMVGSFSRDTIENQFDHFISEEWQNYV